MSDTRPQIRLFDPARPDADVVVKPRKPRKPPKPRAQPTALVLADVPGLHVVVQGSAAVPNEAIRRIASAFADVFALLPADVQDRLHALAATYARLTVFAVPPTDRRCDRIIVGRPQVRSRTTMALLRDDGDPRRQAALVYASVVRYGRRGRKLPDRLADQSWTLDEPAASDLATAWGF